jgi:hypothetical protein
MLLIDLAPNPMTRDNLKASYDEQNGGPGRFDRNPVRVVYVHSETSFNFIWHPHA